jgi:hypothetical protein
MSLVPCLGTCACRGRASASALLCFRGATCRPAPHVKSPPGVACRRGCPTPIPERCASGGPKCPPGPHPRLELRAKPLLARLAQVLFAAKPPPHVLQVGLVPPPELVNIRLRAPPRLVHLDRAAPAGLRQLCLVALLLPNGVWCLEFRVPWGGVVRSYGLCPRFGVCGAGTQDAPCSCNPSSGQGARLASHPLLSHRKECPHGG